MYVCMYVCSTSLLFSNLVLAQTFSTECHVAGAGEPNLNYFGLSVDRSQSEYWIKVYFHIVRKDNGDGGYDPTRIPHLINILDEAFNPHDIYFDYDCATSFLDNTERVTNGGKINPGFWCEWDNIIMPTDGINIFIIANNSGIGADVSGVASGIPGNFMVLVSQAISNYNTEIESTTIIHEMGHLFGMFHLHHGCNKNPLIWYAQDCDPECPFTSAFINCDDFNDPIVDENECAEDSNNGAICGDYIPDTAPSHYFIEGEVIDCTWDPSIDVFNTLYPPSQFQPLIVDPEGNRYDPDITNFMSIIRTKSCRDYFTPNQVTVMKNHLESHPVLEDVITSPPAITCDCPFQNVITVSGAFTNWSSVVQSNSLHPGTLSDYEIRVDGTLNIDVDYNFSNCRFLFGEDDVLSLGAGQYILFHSTEFNSCDEKWQGIDMMSTAYAGFTDCTIKNANIGISSILSSSSTVSLKNNRFMLCNIGLSIRGELIIKTFEDNLFLGGDIGVSATSSSSFLNLSASSIGVANNFNYVNTGIKLDRASADIENNKFHFTNRSISLNASSASKIKNNMIGYRQSGVDVKNSNFVDIWDNTIGSTHQMRGYAVELTSCTHSTIRNNGIESSNIGIRILGCRNVHIVNNDIQIAANNYKNSGGISASLSWDTYILNQDKITVENGIFGIESLMSGAHTIGGNIIDLNPQNWLASAAGIRLLGTDNSRLYKNEALVSGFSSGINLTNAMHNDIDCNELTASVALRVGDNASIQNIQTNILDGGVADLMIRSQTGIQNHNGNIFLGGDAYASDLNSGQVLNSRFRVNSSYPNHLPSNVDPVEWFVDESDIPKTCPGQDPPVFEYFADSISVCTYWDHLKDLKQASYASFHIQFLQFKVLVMAQYGGILPNCILTDTIFTQTCGINYISGIRSELLDFNAVPELLMVDLTDYAAGIEELLAERQALSPKDSLERLSINNQLTATMMHIQALQDSITDLRIATLNGIQDTCLGLSCTDTLSVAWKDIVSITSEYLQGNGVDSTQQDVLREYSSFCPETWGDMIYLARSVTMTFDTASFEVSDHCLESMPPQLPENIETASQPIYEYTAYPNPGNGDFTFRQPEARKTRLYLTDSFGRTVWQGEAIDEMSSFHVEVPSDMYLLYIMDGQSMNTPIKLVIQ